MGFIGYRIFNVMVFNGEPILTSVNARPHYYKYFGPVCNGASPSAYRNNGGFYAFKTFRLLCDTFGIGYYRSSIHTWAELEMFGEVVEHEYGYRSSKVMFRRIAVPRHMFTPKQIGMIEQRYQCDVVFTGGMVYDHNTNSWKGVDYESR